ncbi:transporter substrate-binding domain-containing protein [Desulforamulus aeronauticus]|uniref:Polar amino acid transport system substrate-binding protein n=1 Tax=Desulforamulus aeronauticus DSM 10349 TaxID=1121421 RepID=A0A1M6TEG8_9FIRM|nr:transporter substrate-binding domain-containing protein [Desulforamulus aeronauticus]SHK55397.1 polar amino acid transport system substrate-binding protein [Desulforamulus aeronauticus DSM 10349]
MKKRLLLLLLSLFMATFFLSSTVLAAEQPITVQPLPLKFFVDGIEQTPAQGQPSFVYQGTTYVPLRFVAESLGQPVTWEESTLRIWIGEAPASSKPKIVVGCDPTFPPFESLEPDNIFSGFDIDIMQAIARTTGLEVEFKSVSFDQLFPSLMANQVDAVISGITVTNERQKRFLFSQPYFTFGLVIAVKSNNNSINKFSDLAGKNVAVQAGTYAQMFVEQQSSAKLSSFDTIEQTLTELKNGQVDAVICDFPSAVAYLRANNQDVKLLAERISPEEMGIAVAQNNPELLGKINSGLQKIIASGEYAEICQKWFGDLPK